MSKAEVGGGEDREAIADCSHDSRKDSGFYPE